MLFYFNLFDQIKDKTKFLTIGQRKMMTKKDVYKINKMYECGNNPRDKKRNKEVERVILKCPDLKIGSFSLIEAINIGI